jgi:hypothetical protein
MTEIEKCKNAYEEEERWEVMRKGEGERREVIEDEKKKWMDAVLGETK